MARNVREETTDNWIVLRSTQSREMLVDQVLSERGVETYLPTVRQYIVRRKRRSSRAICSRGSICNRMRT